MPEDERYIIGVLDTALKIIDSMAFSPEEFHSAAEIARDLNINRGRVFRILKTLNHRDFVDYDPKTETYRLGVKLLAISQNVGNHLSLRREAEEVLKNLAADTGDSAYLIIKADNSAIVIDRYLGNNMLQLSAPIGSLLPFHVGAAPKLLLAFMPDEEREQILNKLDFYPFTPNTITDKHTLCKTLDEIRRQGFAIDEQDFEIGAYAFGAPVFDHEGNVVAGISVTTPTARHSPKRREELIQLVVAAARKLSEKLGYQSEQLQMI